MRNLLMVLETVPTPHQLVGKKASKGKHAGGSEQEEEWRNLWGEVQYAMYYPGFCSLDCLLVGGKSITYLAPYVSDAQEESLKRCSQSIKGS